MKKTIRSTELPVPRDALLELGLTAEQIAQAEAAAPLVLAFQADQHPGAWFDVPRARKALRALGMFRHTKGRWAGVPLRLGEGLDPWQVVWVLAPVFGWVYHDAEIDCVVRVIRAAWVEVPRKNGKSTIASGMSGVLLLADGEAGDEVYTLRLRRALVEAIETGTGARSQPLVVFITTADEAEEGTIYDEKHTYTRNVANGIVKDPGHYGVIWAAEETDDPFSEATQAKANPGAGKSPTWAYLRREAQKAQTTPTYFPTYCRLSLNLRRREQSRWLNLTKWDTCSGLVDRAALRGHRAWGGLDLSAVSDFTAWAVWVEDNRPDALGWGLLTHFWVPGDRVEDLQRQLMVPLQTWIDQGFVTATEGDVIDYSSVRAQVIGDRPRNV